MKNLDKYIILHRNKYKYNTQEEQDNKKDKRYLCVKESKLTTICDMCCKNELPKDLFEYIEPPENITYHKYQTNNIIIENKEEDTQNLQNLILFNVGGISNYEVASIEKANHIGQFKFNMILGGNKIYNYNEYFNEIKNYFENKDGITYEDKENPEDFYANDENEVQEEEEKKEKKEKKKKKKKKRKNTDNSMNESYSYNVNEKKSKDYVKIEMKNLDDNDVEEEKLDKSSDKYKIEDEKDESSEERPKKKDKKKKKKKVEMEDIKNKELEEPLKSDKSDEDFDDYK